jgi:hypothetical protein
MMVADERTISITGMISGYAVRFSENNFSYNLESPNPVP